MTDHFGDRLAAAVRSKGNPVVVGLDPRWEQLPKACRGNVQQGDLAAMAQVYKDFCTGIIDVVGRLAPAVKPQAAFFEQLGPPGMAALAHVIRYARTAGLLVILDGKRNDIGATAQAYAAGYLGADSAWGADALTVSPYLGEDSISPFVEACQATGSGIFVLVKTSNPGGGQFQDLVAKGRPLYAHVAEQVEKLAMTTAGESGYGSAGAVVGATYPEQLAQMREAMPHAWILVPGYGSQGGTAKDAAWGFDAAGLGAVINNSRGIIFAHARREYAEKFGEANWQAAAEQATQDMIRELRAETAAGRLSRD